jgi:tRNA threonylcarbamoyladenosine biosynthesis protein TsaB
MNRAEGLLLALDSSTAMGAVAVGGAAGILAEVALNVRGGHSGSLLPAVEHALSSTGLTRRDLGGIVVGGGPGSFTGMRIAGAMASAMASALRVPLYAYSSLLAAAAQGWAASGPVCALFDARGRDVYAATYRFGRRIEILEPPAASTIDEVIARAAGSSAMPLLVGDGAIRHREELRSRLRAQLAPAHFGVPRGAALVWLAATFPEMGLVADPAAWEPQYLRPSGAERIAAARDSGGDNR